MIGKVPSQYKTTEKRGRIPMEEAIDIAQQIAAGLEAAHDQNIVHRDLKPANVKVTPEGKVKILGFGLARAYLGDPEELPDVLQSLTITTAMTGAGVIIGAWRGRVTTNI